MKKCLNLLKWIGILFFMIVLAVICINQMMTIHEKNIYKAPGTMVTVDGKQIHVYTKGEGENTILLMSGLGTVAPVLDFEPLINELAYNNKVVVVEGFGYGWSDSSNKERSVENIVEELREALNKAGIAGPYILMPHSVSGIYAMYYVNTYPEEVKAFVGIDCTLPKMCDYFEEEVPNMPSYMSLLAPSGIARIATTIVPDNFLPISQIGIYSDKNLKMTKAISSWKIYNKTIINEADEIDSNIEKTEAINFNKELPVIIFSRKDTKVREDGKTSAAFYQIYLKNVDNSKFIELEGHHYLHWTNAKTISNAVNDFLKNEE